MKGFFSMFTDSAKEFKSVRCLTLTGVLIAVSMMIESFTIQLPFAKINFAFLAIAAIGMLYGPTVALFAGGICDVVGYLAFPDGGFLPVYILIAMLQGLMYGMVLYQKKASAKPVFIVKLIVARLLDVLIINLCLNTIANLHYGFIQADTVQAAIIARVTKNLLQLVADIPLMLVIMPMILLAYRQVFLRTAKPA